MELAQLLRCSRDLVSDFSSCNTVSQCRIPSTALAIASSKAVKYKQLASDEEKEKSLWVNLKKYIIKSPSSNKSRSSSRKNKKDTSLNPVIHLVPIKIYDGVGCM